MSARIFLLRLLVAWYLIPATWLIMLPIWWLAFGNFLEQVAELRKFSKALWAGFPRGG